MAHLCYWFSLAWGRLCWLGALVLNPFGSVSYPACFSTKQLWRSLQKWIKWFLIPTLQVSKTIFHLSRMSSCWVIDWLQIFGLWYFFFLIEKYSWSDYIIEFDSRIAFFCVNIIRKLWKINNSNVCCIHSQGTKRSSSFYDMVQCSQVFLKITPYAKITPKDKRTHGGKIPKLIL